jgi:hypothetical protein
MKKIEAFRRWVLTSGTASILGCIVYLCLLNQPAKSAPLYLQTEATPTVDRLAIPVLPDHPTQVEMGENVYYYHCMPCHGDKGQGLTSEWRSQWVDDHQNCWGRGCHGSLQNKSFIIPTVVPPVIDKATQARFQKAQDLFTYLKKTHPPQKPGGLKDEEYWAVTAFLLEENGHLPANGTVGPQSGPAWPIIMLGVGIALVPMVFIILYLRSKVFRSQIDR